MVELFRWLKFRSQLFCISQSLLFFSRLGFHCFINSINNSGYILLNKLMIQKNTLILFMCMLAIAYSQCPRNCTNCTTPTTCDVCQAGSFLVNGTFCAPCPTGCSACAPGPDGRPACSACASPAQLGPDGRCFLCDPSCLTCAQSPRNCTTCPDGKELTYVNATNVTNGSNLTNGSGTVGSCGNIAGCPIQKCGECAPPDAQNTTFCARCIPGYFPYRQSCFACQSPCAACDYNLDQIWRQIVPAINQTIRLALTFANITDLSRLPPFMHGLDFFNMTEELRRGWIQAFYVMKLSITAYPNPADLIASIPRHIQFMTSIQNYTWPDQERAILQRINTVLAKNWTLPELYYRTGLIAATFTQCAECQPGFQNNTNGTACERCPVGCQNCTGGTCSACQDGFFDNGGNCTRCTPPCAACDTSATSCTRCLPPASLSGSTCVLCAEPCATCQSSNTTSCLTCKRPFSLTADSGACFRCNQDLCVDCQPGNTSICIQCRPGATLVNGRCQLCPVNCSSCSSTSPPTCFECLAGFQLRTVDNGTRCVPCGPGCTQCVDDACVQCLPGTFLNSDTKRCQRCKIGCKVCSSLEVCTVSQSGVAIISGNAVSCKPGCKSCDGSPDRCSECELRYFLVDDICRRCEPGCETCTNETFCTKCVGNQHLADGNCSQCLGNCRTCSNANLTSCLSCKRGFTLNGTDCVHQCERGCLECDPTNSSICITCAQGHALRQNGKCVKCLGSCSGTCDPRNISICLGCVDGFELRENKCMRCALGCATCLNGECSNCAPGFKLAQLNNGSFYCAEKCRPPCATCSGTTCNSCETGFVLSNNRCTPDLSCNPNCQFCPAGTEQQNGTCVSCPTNCATCVNGTCLQCQKGFYLNGASCTQCPPRCRTCYNGNSCEDCAPGFVKEILSMGTDGISDATFSDNCIACSTNCATCVVEPTRCASCPDGFRLFGYRCNNLYTVQATMELNINYTTFLENSQSQDVSQAIATHTNIESDNIALTQLREGSTVADLTISASSPQQAASVQSQLGSVSGIGLLAVSATVFYGDSQYTAPPSNPEQQPEAAKPAATTNVGLIVGVVVGGVVLIAVVTFLIYKFKCKKPEQIRIEDESAIVAKQQA